MNKRILRFLAVLFLSTSAATAFAGNGESLLKYLPDGSQIVFSVDVQSMRGSRIMTDIVSSLQSQSEFSSIETKLRESGFEPTEQIHTLVGAATSMSASARPLIIAEGPFPRAQLEQSLRAEEQATATEVSGHTIFEVPNRGATTFLSDTIIAVGPRALVEQAIANKGRSSAGFGSSMASLVSSADHSRNIWIASKAAENPRTAGTSLAQAQGIAMAISLTNGLNLTAHISTASAEAAQTISDDLTNQLTQLKSRDEVAALGLAGVIEAATVSTSGSSAVIQVTLEEARWNRLFHTLKSIVSEQLR